MRKSKAVAVVVAAASTAVFAAACGSSNSSSGGSSVDWSKVTHLTASGPDSMANLVKDAEKEGQLNVITLPSNWANYGNIMKDFTAKYHIHITDAIPEGSSGQELQAIQTEKGQSRAPDVVDVGTPFAVEGARLPGPVRGAVLENIPADAKDANGDYYADYGGYVAIGYDPAKVKVPPTSFASLTNPAYKNMIGLNNSPTTAGAAFAAVYAAALANGGSYSNIMPGIQYFAHLKKIGNFVPTAIGGPTTVQNGTTPILICGTTCWPRRFRRWSRDSRSSSRRTLVSRPITTKRSAPRRRIQPRHGCGRSTSTPPPARTSGCRASPARSSCRRW